MVEIWAKPVGIINIILSIIRLKKIIDNNKKNCIFVLTKKKKLIYIILLCQK
jgi:hypothetical protein